MSEPSPIEMLDKLFDTLDIVVDAVQPIATGDLGEPKPDGAAPAPQQQSAPPPMAPPKPRPAPQPIAAAPQAPQPPPKPTSQPVAQPIAAPPAAPAPAPAPVDAFFEQNAAYAQATKDLHAGAYAKARASLETLAKANPTMSEYAAAAHYARFKLATTDAQKQEEVRKLGELSEKYPYCVTSLTFLARMNIELDRIQTAVRFLKQATDLVPERPDVLAELRKANELLIQIKKSKESKTQGDSDVQRTVRPKPEEIVDEKPAWAGLSMAIVIFGAYFGVFVMGGLGKEERWWNPENPIVWARLGVLAFVGLLAARMFLKDKPLGAEDFSMPIGGTIGAIILGSIAAIVLPGMTLRLPIAVIAGIAFAQVLAEEIFFRVYLGRAMHAVGSKWKAPLIGGVLYGVYQLTFYTTWFAAEPGEGSLRVLMITALAGMPYAFLYHRTRSLLPPLIAHTIVGLAIALSSSY